MKKDEEERVAYNCNVGFLGLETAAGSDSKFCLAFYDEFHEVPFVSVCVCVWKFERNENHTSST